VQCRRRLQLVRIIDESERQHRDAISELFVNVKYPCAAPRRGSLVQRECRGAFGR
jgi:hypothetical protein